MLWLSYQYHFLIMNMEYIIILSISINLILGGNLNESLLVVVGDNASFEWELNPKPDRLETVIINKDGNTNLYSFSSVDEDIIFQGYENRILLKQMHDQKNDMIKFILKKAKKTDAGLYFTRYRNNNYMGQELIILDKPDMPYIDQLTQLSGSNDFVINCTIWSNSNDTRKKLTMKFQWIVNGDMINVDKMSRYILSNSTLTIKSLSSIDQGKQINCYAYELMDLVSELSAPFIIDFIHKLKTPKVKEVFPPIRDRNLTLECIVERESHIPELYNIAKYIWKTNRQYGEQKKRYIKYENIFKLMKIKIEDNGTLIYCHTATENGDISEFSSQYKVVVLHGPSKLELEPNEAFFSTTVGSTVPDIYCRVDCAPKCNITWIKKKQPENEIYHIGRVLYLGQLTYEKGGEYYCRAENLYGTTNSVPVGIDIYDMNLKKEMSCSKDDFVIISCVVKSVNRIPVFLPWVHERNKTTLRTIKGITGDNISSIVISKCSFRDVGAYVCRIRNFKSSIEAHMANTTLSIHGAPAIIQEKAYTSQEYSKASLIVNFYSDPDPISVQWIRNLRGIQPNSKFKMSMVKSHTMVTLYNKELNIDCFKASLTIFNLTTADYGKYTIEITNGKGVMNYSLSLSPKDEFPVVLVVSVSIGGISAFVIIAAVMTRVYRNQKRRQRNGKVLEQIRHRLAKLEAAPRLRPISDEISVDHYQTIDEDILGIHQPNEDNFIQDEFEVFSEDSDIEEYASDISKDSDIEKYASDLNQDEEIYKNSQLVDDSEIEEYISGNINLEMFNKVIKKHHHSSSDISDVEVEEFNSSREDLKIAIHPSPYVNSLDADVNILIVEPSDVESNLADDEISSSSLETSE